jgi:hypothetical protein
MMLCSLEEPAASFFRVEVIFYSTDVSKALPDYTASQRESSGSYI